MVVDTVDAGMVAAAAAAVAVAVAVAADADTAAADSVANVALADVEAACGKIAVVVHHHAADAHAIASAPDAS